MRYALWQCLRRIRANWLTQSLLYLQLVSGFLLLCVALNMLLAARQVVAKPVYRQENVMRAEWWRGQDGQWMYLKNDPQGLTVQDHGQLRREFQDDAELIYSYAVHLFGKTENEIVTYTAIFMPPEQFSAYGQVARPAGETLQMLENTIAEEGIFPKEATDAVIAAAKNQTVLAVSPNLICQSMLLSLSGDMDENSVPVFLLPLEALEISDTESTWAPALYVRFKNENMRGVGRRLIARLYALHPQGVEYALVDLTHNVKPIVNNAAEHSRTVFLIAISILVAVAISYTSALLIAFEKRRREYAILSCLGASPRQLILEAVLENVALVFAFAMMGTGLGSLLTPLFGNNAFVIMEIRPQPVTAIALIGFAALPCALLTAMLFGRLSRLSAAQNLAS